MRKKATQFDVSNPEPIPEFVPPVLSSEPHAKPSEQPFFTVRVGRRTVRYAIVTVIIIGILFLAARIFHWHNWGLSAQEVQTRETATLVQKVGALMLLPTGETPVVASVTDAQSLKSQQPFYKDAQNGDVLLVYAQAERAILYRSSTNKIINVGPVYLNQDAPSSAQ